MALRLAEPAIDHSRFHRTYSVYTFSAAQNGYVQGGGIRHIGLAGGRLQIDDLPVFSPRLVGPQITWHQQTPGHYTSGALYLEHGGTGLRGVVYRGTTPADAVAHFVSATSLPPVTFTTSITKRRYPAGTNPAGIPPGDWQAGLALTVQSLVDARGHRSSVETLVGKGWRTPYDLSAVHSWSLDEASQTPTLGFMVRSDVYCLDYDDGYLQASVTFDYNKPIPTFSGAVQGTCGDPEGDGVYLWKGTAGSALTFHSAAALASLSIQPTDVLTTSTLSVGELYSLLPDSEVANKANDLLLECMRWAMGQDSEQSTWLARFFGERPPVLGKARQDLARGSLDWYQNHFAKAYVSWTVANYDGSNAPSVRLADDQRLKLKYYLQTGLAKDADYNKQQLGLYGAAFVEVKPRLQAYVDDGGEKWAQAFYDEVSASAHLTLLINTYFLTGSALQLNHYSALLNALQPSGALALQLQKLVITGTIAQTTSDAKLSADTPMPWLGDWLRKFLDKIAENTSLIPEDAQLAVQQMREYVNAVGGSYTKVAEEMFNLMANSGGHSLLGQAKSAENAFAEAHPRFAKAGGLIVMAAWAGGFFHVVGALKSWKDLDERRRTDVVVALVDFSVQAVLGVPEVLFAAKATFSSVLDKMRSWFATEPGRDGMMALMRADGVHELEGAEDPVRQAFSEEAQAAQAAKIEGTVWERVFPKASKAVAVIGAACAVYFAYRSTQDFMSDLRSGSVGTEQKAYDGVIMAANIGTAVCLTLSLAITSTIIPIAGAILAVVGIIVSIIEAHRVSPPNPLDDFMRDVVIPYVSGLGPQVPPPSGAVKS